MNGLHTLRHIPAKFPLMIFLLSAGVGAWASYDPVSAWAKFTTLALAVILYLILAFWPAHRMGLMAWLLTILGAGISLYFLLTADWSQTPADWGLINRLGLAWMRLRPPLLAVLPQTATLHPNIAGGVIAAFLPFGLAATWTTWEKSRTAYTVKPTIERPPSMLLLALGVLSIGVSSVGLLMTSSRAAGLALLAGLGLWLWWQASQPVSARLQTKRELTFGLPVILALAVSVTWSWLRFGDLLNLANAMPGAASANSRIEIAWNSLHLGRAFFFTGGGLAAFPGLYARYMRVIPVYDFGYAHNLYLDLLVEQGIFGLIAFLGVAFSSLISLWDAMRRGVKFASPVFAGLTVMLLHGFMDDAFYGMGGTSLLFVLPGLAAALHVQKVQVARKESFHARTLWIPSVITLAVIMVITLLPAAQATLRTNLAAVSMSKIQLTGWPDVPWYDPDFGVNIQPAQAQLESALELNPNHVPALYRLGMIALEMRDFDTADGCLEKAHLLAPGHLGVQKNLGYVQLWLGNFAQAKEHLATFTEIQQELDYYSWWWETQERSDLAGNAIKLRQLLRE